MTDLSDDEVIAVTRQWVEKAVIGLNLCPFSHAPYRKGRVRLQVSQAQDVESLLQAVAEELQFLSQISEDEVETALLIHPHVLNDFLDFNDFLDLADALLEEMDLVGEWQIASFHPDYQFADSPPDDMANYTNRSPYPTLHFLRGSSIDRAVESMADTDSIYRRNIERLRGLGMTGWQALWENTRI